MSRFIKLLIAERTKRGITKKQAAEIMNWTAMYYGRYENGALLPTKNNIPAFARFLRMPVTELEKIVEEDKTNPL